jgi:serine/threonine protein kinase
MTCRELEELLVDLVNGELESGLAEEARRHLQGCAACAANLRATRELLGDLKMARSLGATRPISSAAEQPPGPPSAAPRRLGDFEILEEIGRGGMGVVYRARQISLNRVVALKVLAGAALGSSRAAARFQNEALAAARLHHTNIVPIYAQGCEQGFFFYAMELIEGRPLSQVLREDPALSPLTGSPRSGAAVRSALSLDVHETGGESPARGNVPGSVGDRGVASGAISGCGPTARLRTPRDFMRIARLVAEVADGLAHAHRQGIIHRDIKPQNLLLGRDDHLHITDFGLARLLDEPGLTLSTELVGTPAYMAPEQVSQARGAIDHRTDIYALGVTLYALLTLRRPFEGQTYDQIISQVLHREPTPPRRIDPHIPQDLQTICLRAMEKEPRRRFARADELAADLRRYAEHFPIRSRRVSWPGRVARWVRRRPATASALAAATIVAVLIPALYATARALANARLDAAFEEMLEDYNEGPAILAGLGWAAWLPADPYRRARVEALGNILQDPLLPAAAEAVVRRFPNVRDARYLAAWACVRAMKTRGEQMWLRAHQHLEAADALPGEASAAGYFFRGMSLVGMNPRSAVQSFQDAIAGRRNFTLAMMHQARAMNQIMYQFRELSHYESACTTLQTAIRLAPRKAYPRYLLSITHRLAGEILEEQGRNEPAGQAFERALAAAREAQECEPASLRGFAVEAEFHESRGHAAARRGDAETAREAFARALNAWVRSRLHGPNTRLSDVHERAAYSMRLAFWLDRHEESCAALEERYAAAETYSAEQAIFRAAILTSTGRRENLPTILAGEARRAGPHAEDRLTVEAAYRLAGLPVPPGWLAAASDFEQKLSPGWTRPWLETLYAWRGGEIGADELLSRAKDLSGERAAQTRAFLAGAHFFLGIDALAAGRRDEAIDHLVRAVEQHDNERYSFNALFLLEKLQTDPAWPSWLSTDR